MRAKMAFNLRNFVCSVNVGNGTFKSLKDKHYADELYQRHSLQSMLAETKGLVGKDVPKCVKDGIPHYLTVLTVLIENSPDEWISTFIYGFNHPETFALCVKCLRSSARIAEPEPFTDREYTVYDASDFVGVADKTVLVLNLLNALLKQMSNVGRSRKALDQKPAILHLCYVFMEVISGNMVHHPWTSDESEKVARECLDLLMKEFRCLSVCELLKLDTKHVLPLIEHDTNYNTMVKKSVFGKLLIVWKSNLEKNSWRFNPFTVASFQWCVHQMEFPHLSHFIELILPPILQFMDDHMVENKMNGTRCLVHLLKNCGLEELRWNGRAEVIYSALKQQLLLTDEILLPVTHEAVQLVLNILVADPSAFGQSSKYDEIFQLLLQAASHENKPTLRRVHTQPLHTFIEHLGINSVKYTQLLLDIFQEYLEISDAPTERTRLNVLMAVKSFIKVSYPRIHNHSPVLLKMLIRLLHEVTSKKSNMEEEVEKALDAECTECIELLKIVDESNAQADKDSHNSGACAE